MQATVFSYDEGAGTGSVITDQGLVLPFDADVLRASGLRHLRPGQRLSVTTNATGRPDRPAQDDATAVTAFRLGSIVAD